MQIGINISIRQLTETAHTIEFLWIKYPKILSCVNRLRLVCKLTDACFTCSSKYINLKGLVIKKGSNSPILFDKFDQPY